MFITRNNALTDAYFHGKAFVFPLKLLSTSSLIKN